MIEIIINGREYICDKNDKPSYEEIIAIEGYYGNYPTVTYRRAKDGKQGMLNKGETVEIVNGTIFNVVDTGNA